VTGVQAIRILADRAAGAYAAGADLASLAAVCRRLHDQKLLTTVCYWNRDSDSSQEVAAAYNGLLDVISTWRSQSYLSAKAPALGFESRLLRSITERARQTGVLVHFDSLAPETVSPTFNAIAELQRGGVRLGVTLPARWRRSEQDAEEAIERGLRIRIVKGEWPDAGRPDVEPVEGFLKLVDQTAGRAGMVAVATHDRELATEALRRLKTARTPCELELRYGYPLRRPVHAARDLNAPVRVYVPYGRAWLPYRLHSAPHEPRVLYWFVRDLVRSL
jgi:proline dehydrogenase